MYILVSFQKVAICSIRISIA